MSRIYVHPQMAEMASILADQGLLGLAEKILELEETYCPDKSNSRILDNPSYEKNMVLLLSQMDQAMLDAILENRLVEEVQNGRLTLKSWAVITPSTQKGTAAGVYANYIATRYGSGLSMANYHRYNDGMLALIEDRLMNDGTDIRKLADAYYRLQTGSTDSKVGDMIKSCKLHIDDYKDYQNALLQDAARQGATEIRFMGEVGWAINVNERVHQHQTFQGSANFFRLTRCVLGALFPNTFRVHSYCLYRALQFAHAEVGESGGTHLTTGYGKYGGFNFHQAAMSVDSARKLDARQWKEVCNQNKATMVFMETRLQDEYSKLEQKFKEKKEELAIYKHAEQLEAMDYTVTDIFDHIDATDQKFADLFNKCKAAIRDLQVAVDARMKQKQRYMARLRQLTKGLDAVKLSAHDTLSSPIESEGEQAQRGKSDSSSGDNSS